MKLKIISVSVVSCTVDDAAIYQVSASNSKGIVSCSGVLEVGTMNEFKIHQRFFAKLKQKAEKKRSDLDTQTKKEDKENIQKEKQSSPEHPQRKRHAPPPEERPRVKKPEVVEQVGAAAEPNGVNAEVSKEAAHGITKDSDLDKEVPAAEKTLAKKKIKISNGVDAAMNSNSGSNSRSHMMGNGGENCYDGGISLAQFLAETLQSQTSEEKQNPPQEEKSKEMDGPFASASKEKEREPERMQKDEEEQESALKETYDREKRREEELATEKEREREKDRPLALSHTVPHTKLGSEVKHPSKAHKDHDHHNIQASISSMLHTVKDFLFGKSKKDSHDHEKRERDHSPVSTQPSRPDTPPSFRLQPAPYQVSPTDDIVPMEMDSPKDSSESVNIEPHSVSQEPHKHRHEDSVLQPDLPPAHRLPPEIEEESTGKHVKPADDAVEAMELSVGPEGSSPGEEMSLSGLRVVTEVCSVVLQGSWLPLECYI